MLVLRNDKCSQAKVSAAESSAPGRTSCRVVRQSNIPISLFCNRRNLKMLLLFYSNMTDIPKRS